MFHDIDKLQSEIDKLNSLCSDSLGTPEAAPKDIATRRRERLGVFILKLLDGVLEQRYLARLEKWLIADEAARRYYVDFMKLTALLRIYYHPTQFQTPAMTETLKQ
jgi:hypothetical protein